ncbi:MAG TPA: hypothetical protein VHG30_03555 [Microvirga sp.]|nr:hypothetical protein [Microvirga sp.]
MALSTAPSCTLLEVRSAVARAHLEPRTLLDARSAVARAQLELRSLRLARALKRFNPSQPRVPAGHPDGGQWTDGGWGGGGTPRAEVVSLRPRPRATRVIGGRPYPVTPAQEARLDISAAQARALVREVQRHDPTWRPQPSLYEGVEGQIRANQSDAQQAAARLRELGRAPPEARPLAEVLLPEGRPIGVRSRGAGPDTRTVTPSEFNEMLQALSPGAEVVPSPSAYMGVWYRRPDGSIFGVRRSEEHGMTFDVIRSNSPALDNGYKVHQQ